MATESRNGNGSRGGGNPRSSAHIRGCKLAVPALGRCDQISQVIRRARDEATSVLRGRVSPHIAAPAHAREASVEQEYVKHRSSALAHLLEAKLNGEQRITRPVQSDERTKLGGERLPERAVGATARKRSESLGRQRARIGRMRSVALRRANELFGEDPLRAKPALAEGEPDLVVDLTQQLSWPLDRGSPPQAVARAQVMSRNDDDLLSREARERAVRQRRDLRVWISAARAGGDERNAGGECEASHECGVWSQESNHDGRATAKMTEYRIRISEFRQIH